MIVNTIVPGLIGISSLPQVQKVQEQSGSNLRAVEQDRSAIAPANSTQQPELLPRLIVTSGIEGAIATGKIPQEQAASIPAAQLSRDISLTVPSLAKAVSPVVPKKLTQEELDAVEDALKGLRINPDSCISVIKKYWENVGGAIARVKEGIQHDVIFRE